MLRKYSILLGIIISILLLLVATLYYPGGSQYDKNSIGYDWKNNYISNLLGEKAVNCADNASRFWAIPGVFFFSISGALFFIKFSKKIPYKTPSKVIKYFGVSATIFAFLTVTPYHDAMVTIADTLSLVSIFYITVFTFKSKLRFSKILSVIYMLATYCSTYIYYTRNYLEILPIMQKVTFAISIVWILWLEYFTKKEDFQTYKIAKQEIGDKTTSR